jgi:cytochrome c-type biogenesis protein
VETYWILGLGVLFGALAFFEPCAIASNILFTQHLQRAAPAERQRQLCRMASARILLLVGLGVAAGAAARAGGVTLPELLLPVAYGVFGVVYVVSRFVYIPVPHIYFYRVIPRADARLGDGAKVGLTLPACTIPLAGALIMALAGAGNPLVAAATMFLFAVCFSLPAFVYASRPATPAALRFLGLSARATPYLTGALFAAVAAGRLVGA